MNYNDYAKALVQQDYDRLGDAQSEYASEQFQANEKLRKLEEAKKAKLDRLGANKQYANLDSSHTVMPDGNIESNANKIYNDLNAIERQFITGYAFNDINTNPEDADARRLYGYITKDGEHFKGGLSTGNADTSDVRYDNTIDPRYDDEWRKSGPEGPDLTNKQLDARLDFDAATVVEGMWHGNKENLANRKYPDYLSEEALMHDGGVSEYYKGKGFESVLGDASEQTLTPEREAELVKMYEGWKQLPGAENKYAGRNKTAEQIEQEMEAAEIKSQGLWGEAKQTVAGAFAGATEGGIELLDAAQELATYPIQAAWNAATGDKVDIDLIPNDFKKKWIENVDEFYGYNKQLDQVELQEITKDLDKIGFKFADPSTWNKLADPKALEVLGESTLAVITNPSLTANMLSQIVGSGGVAGVLTKTGMTIGSKVAPKLTNKFDNVVKSNRDKIDQQVAVAEKLGASADELKAIASGYTKTKKAVDILKGTTMSNADMAVRMNQWMDDYKENNNGEDPSLGKVLQMGFMARAVSSAEIGSLKLAYNGTKLTDATAKGLKAGITKAFTDLGIGSSTELVQETFDGIAEQIATKEGAAKYEGKTIADIINENSAEILTGSVAGLGSGAQVSMAGTGVRGIAESGKQLKEVIDDKLDNQVGPNEKRSSTRAGRRNIYESYNPEAAPEFESDTQRENWIADTVQYGTEEWVKAGEQSADNADYNSNPTKIWDDVTDRVAQVRGITSQEGKDIIKDEVVRQIFANTRGKTSEGKYKYGKESRNGILSSIYNYVKGNKKAEHEFERQYEEELKLKFDDIKKRLAEEGVKDFSTNGTLTEAELESLEATLEDMRKLGSEELTDLATKVKQVLKKREEVLGSEDKDGKPNKKKLADVKKEVEELGFFTDKGGYKSIKQHKRDLEDFVTSGESTPEADEAINAIDVFVGSRNNKIKLFDTQEGEDTRARSIGEIKIFSEAVRNESKAILDMIAEVEANTPESDYKNKLQAMMEQLNETVKEYNYILDEKDGNKIYDHLIADKNLTPGEKKALAKARKITSNYKDPYETGASAEEEIVVTQEAPTMSARIKNFVDRAIQQEENNGLDSVAAINKVIERVIKSTKDRELNESKEAVVAYLKNKRRELGKEAKKEEPTVETKVEEQKEVKETPVEVQEEVKEEFITPESIPEEKTVAELEAEVSYYIDAEASVLEAKKQAEKVFEDIKKKVDPIQAEINDLYKEKKGLEGAKKKLREDVNRLDAMMNRAAKRIETLDTTNSIKKLVAAVFQGLEKVVNTARKIVERVTKLKERKEDKIVEIEAKLFELEQKIAEKEGSISEEDRTKREEAKEAVVEESNQLAEVRRMKKDAETELAKKFREDIEKVVGEAVSPNESKKMGLTSRLLTATNKLKSLMSIMPKIISENENGVNMIDEAVKTLDEFAKARAKTGKSRFHHQASEDEKAILAKFGLDKLFSDPEIEEKVTTALNVTSLLALSDMEAMKQMPTEMLRRQVEGAFGNLWGNGNSEKKHTEVTKLMQKIRKGEIVPIQTFAMSAGRRFLEELEIKLNVETMQDKDDIINLLGNIVIDNVLNNSNPKNRATSAVNGIITRNDADGPLVFKDGKINTEEKNKLYQTLTPKEANAEIAKRKNMASVRVMNLSNIPAETMKSIREASTVFEYAGERTDGMISFKPVVHDADKRGRNSDVQITETEINYLNKQGSRKWKFDPLFREIYEDQAGKDVNKLKKLLLGTKEDIYKNVHPMEVESALSKYVADELDIERMVMAYELAGEKDFYIGWDYTVSNRSMMNNKMINPQNSKLSRFIISMDGMVNTLDGETKTQKDKENDVHMSLLGIAQGFDLDPDKYTDATIIKGLSEGTLKVENAKGEKVGFKVNLEVEDGKVVLGEVSPEIRDVLDKGVTLASIRENFHTSPSEIMHMYQALELLRKIEKGEPLRTNLALEADGITNGMSTTGLQMGYSNETIEGTEISIADYFDKVGIYFEGSKYTSHGDFKEKGGLDFYEAPIESFKAELKTPKSSLVNEYATSKSTMLVNKLTNYTNLLLDAEEQIAYSTQMLGGFASLTSDIPDGALDAALKVQKEIEDKINRLKNELTRAGVPAEAIDKDFMDKFNNFDKINELNAKLEDLRKEAAKEALKSKELTSENDKVAKEKLDSVTARYNNGEIDKKDYDKQSEFLFKKMATSITTKKEAKLRREIKTINQELSLLPVLENKDIKAVERINKIMENLDAEDKTKQIEDDKKKSNLEETVAKLVGGKWRSFFKPLVMVFIYGAGMKNIRRNGSAGLVETMVTKAGSLRELKEQMDAFLADPKVQDAMNNEKNEFGKVSRAVNMIRNNFNSIKPMYYDVNSGMLKPLTRALSGKVKAGLVPNDRMLDAMATIVDISMGEAIENSFNETFKPVVEYRKALKTVNMLNYAGFVVAFKKNIKEMFGTTQMNQLSREQLVEVKDKMVKDGTYYGSKNVHGGTQDYFKTQQDKNEGHEGSRIKVALSGPFADSRVQGGGFVQDINQVIKTIASNIGAVGVIDVHSIDGATMIEGNIEDVLNIFDALVLGTDYKLNNRQMKELNRVYYEINMKHSILGNAVERALSNAELIKEFAVEDDATLKADFNSDITRVLGLGFNDDKVGAFKDGIEDIMRILDEVHDRREKLVDMPADVLQYYVSDLFEAARWEGGVDKSTRYAVYKDRQAESKVLRELLEGLGNALTPKESKPASPATSGPSTGLQQEADTINKKFDQASDDNQGVNC